MKLCSELALFPFRNLSTWARVMKGGKRKKKEAELLKSCAFCLYILLCIITFPELLPFAGLERLLIHSFVYSFTKHLMRTIMP